MVNHAPATKISRLKEADPNVLVYLTAGYWQLRGPWHKIV